MSISKLRSTRRIQPLPPQKLHKIVFFLVGILILFAISYFLTIFQTN